jgi:4-aminobutyrate aminotransferase-like enzyme
VGEHLRVGLSALQHPAIVSVRGPGLFIGVEFSDGATTSGVVERLRNDGVLVGATGARSNVLKIRPPLVFAERHADLLLRRVRDALESRP